jgi:hypothetical protein
MNLDDVAKQTEFAEMVGATQQAVGKHVNGGVLDRGASYRQWLISYCERLRNEASGRVASQARERRDMAQAEESEINTEMKRRTLWKEEGLLLDLDSVREVLNEWSGIGKNEFIGAVDKIITAIESEHAITIDRETIKQDVDAALKCIGSYTFEPGELGAGSSGDLDASA